MNLGWDLQSDLPMPIHEIGHAIGLLHEHQHPRSGITWDAEQVYKTMWYWTKAVVDFNILKVYAENELSDFTAFDPFSIMMYGLPKSCFKAPAQFAKEGTKRGNEITDHDKELVKRMYLVDAVENTIKEDEVQKVSSNSKKYVFDFTPANNGLYKILIQGNVGTTGTLSIYDNTNVIVADRPFQNNNTLVLTYEQFNAASTYKLSFVPANKTETAIVSVKISFLQ